MFLFNTSEALETVFGTWEESISCYSCTFLHSVSNSSFFYCFPLCPNQATHCLKHALFLSTFVQLSVLSSWVRILAIPQTCTQRSFPFPLVKNYFSYLLREFCLNFLVTLNMESCTVVIYAHGIFYISLALIGRFFHLLPLLPRNVTGYIYFSF